jgi:hypothetical protein
LLPPQLSNSQIENEKLTSLTNSIIGGTKLFVGLTGFFNILLSAALSQLWSMINAL